MTTRFIVVEGNHCTGKTTLVEELRGILSPQGWDTKNLVHRPGNQFHRYLLEYATADRVVYNRSHYAELVYGQFYRGKNPFGKSEVQALDAVVEADGLVIYCDLPVKDIKMRLERRNSTEVLSTDETTLEELTANSAAFEEVFKDRNVIRYRAYLYNIC
jgi:thymidylate kinase